MRVLRDLGLLLRGHDFRRLFAVRIASQTSDGIFQVALASYVFFSPERQASPQAIAAGFAAILLPFSLLGPFTGVFIDRWSRRQILVWCNLARIPVMLVIAGLVAAGVADLTLFVTVLVALSVNRFLLAALSAALPHVVHPRRLVMANSVTPTCGTAAFLAGVAIGGLVREVVSVYGGARNVSVLVVAAAGYGLAAWLATRMHRELLGPDYDPRLPTVREHARHVLVGLVDGLIHVWARRPAAYGLLTIGSHRFFYGLSTVATILLYRSYFHDPGQPDAGFAGLALAVLVSGAGFVAAAFATPIATQRLSLRQWILTLLLLAAVAGVFPGGFYTEPTLLCAAFALGLSAQGVKISVDTIVQATVDDAFRGRVFVLYDVVFNVAFVAAAVAGAFVLPQDGKSYPVLALVATGYLATAAAYAWAPRPRLLQN